jgi:hypothetical protein
MSQSVRKKSIFLSEESERWIVVTTQPYESYQSSDVKSVKWTESINASILNLKSILASALPDFTNEEWSIIFSIIKRKTKLREAVENQINFLAFKKYDISEDIKDFSFLLNSKQECERANLLAQKIHSMTKVEQLSILYFLQVFLLDEWTDWEVARIVEQVKQELYE